MEKHMKGTKQHLQTITRRKLSVWPCKDLQSGVKVHKGKEYANRALELWGHTFRKLSFEVRYPSYHSNEYSSSHLGRALMLVFPLSPRYLFIAIFSSHFAIFANSMYVYNHCCPFQSIRWMTAICAPNSPFFFFVLTSLSVHLMERPTYDQGPTGQKQNGYSVGRQIGTKESRLGHLALLTSLFHGLWYLALSDNFGETFEWAFH